VRRAGQADSHIQSWTYWQFKLFHDITTASAAGGESFYLMNGTLDTPKVRALCRTYAPAIAGVPTTHMFDPLNATFNLVYTIDQVRRARPETSSHLLLLPHRR